MTAQSAPQAPAQTPPASAPRPKNYEAYRNALAGRPMPLAFVDLDLYDANVRDVMGRMGGKPMRIASKSIRCLELIRRVLAISPRFQGLMCYTGYEAVWLAGRGLDDLLVAYPIWGEAQIEAVGRVVASGKRVTLMVDCAEHVARIAEISKRIGVKMPLAVDIDMSIDVPGLHFGVRRSPIDDAAKLAPVLDAVERASEHVFLEGLMGYEAQVAGVPDKVPGAGLKNAVVGMLKRRSISAVADRRAACVALIASRGHKLRFVNGGGTGSLESTREEDCVTEVTAGSAFYSPALFDNYERFHHPPAAGFAIEITRIPIPGVYTCHGGGYTSSGSAGPEKLPRPYMPAGATLIQQEGAGEVQTPIVYSGPVKLAHGDPILMRHAKAGELCEHFKSLVLIENGKVVNEVPTYRGEGECFIG